MYIFSLRARLYPLGRYLFAHFEPFTSIYFALMAAKVLGRVYALETGLSAPPCISRVYDDAVRDSDTTRLLLLVLLRV